VVSIVKEVAGRILSYLATLRYVHPRPGGGDDAHPEPLSWRPVPRVQAAAKKIPCAVTAGGIPPGSHVPLRHGHHCCRRHYMHRRHALRPRRHTGAGLCDDPGHRLGPQRVCAEHMGHCAVAARPKRLYWLRANRPGSAPTPHTLAGTIGGRGDAREIPQGAFHQRARAAWRAWVGAWC
jgi:hypothetical protein